MKIGVVGGGVVGSATARSYLEHVEEVRIYDVTKERSTSTLEKVMECDLVFLCLPTPQKKDSLECDTTAIDNFFESIYDDPVHEFWEDTNFVLRSTVPIGTTKRLSETYGVVDLVHSPEFLTARCSFTDAQTPSRNIVGGLWDGDLWNHHDHPIVSLYEKRFPGVPVLKMSSDESEAVKLFLNSFFAVKVAYFNEIQSLAEEIGLDWEDVREGMLSDGRIAHSHTQVPGPDGLCGFGGTCLPKDLANLVCTLKTKLSAYPELVTEAALGRNKYDRTRSRKPQ